MNNRDRLKGIRELLASRRAASAAEFALVLPLLLTLILGTLQVGAMMYSYNLMASSARDTVQAMAVCTITTIADAKTQALKSLPPWVPKAHWVITPAIGTDVSMQISVPVTDAAILSYVPFTLTNLTTFVTMRKEPLAFGGGSC
ncbi:pilus assembly protein [Sphingosinicellaceae bacterium]|nr:pilus assembly protein [Sphingosinicellaceae bacterium]